MRSGLTPECREALRTINRHFHDLRHEAGSRLSEAGMPLHYVKLFMDHANIATTDRYLNGKKQGMHDALQRVERSRCKPVASQPDQGDLTETAVVEKYLQ